MRRVHANLLPRMGLGGGAKQERERGGGDYEGGKTSATEKLHFRYVTLKYFIVKTV